MLCTPMYTDDDGAEDKCVYPAVDDDCTIIN